MDEFDVLFVHNNFPAQFKNLAKKLSGCPGIRVHAIAARGAAGMQGVNMLRYRVSDHEVATMHAFARRFEIESRRAEQVMYAASALKLKGVIPKLIYVHPGWGEALPLRVVFPDAMICTYAEFYYAPTGTDIGFDNEFPPYGVDGEVRIVLRNAASLLSLVDATVAIAPTQWQRSVFPHELQPKIHVVHDGLDTAGLARPARPRTVEIPGHRFAPGQEIVTYVARNLEPYRGFHLFMRALPRILQQRPEAHICIVGGDGVGYGYAPVDFANWRLAMMAELGDRLDLSRVHFLGKLPYETYLALLALSSAHVYLTYPFVLSWSVLEAMALECLVIGSDTPPVTEVLRHGENGLLVPFFDSEALADTVVEALAEPQRHAALRKAARQAIVDRYDFQATSLPQHIALIDEFSFSPRLINLLRSGLGL
ncbi:glycosyltransferase [Bosea thiooxidans]